MRDSDSRTPEGILCEQPLHCSLSLQFEALGYVPFCYALWLITRPVIYISNVTLPIGCRVIGVYDTHPHTVFSTVKESLNGSTY